MKGKGPRIERETVIGFNHEEDTASIWTASEVIYRRLVKRLGRVYLTDDGDGMRSLSFPKNLSVCRGLKPNGYLPLNNGLRWQLVCLGPDKLSRKKGKVGYL